MARAGGRDSGVGAAESHGTPLPGERAPGGQRSGVPRPGGFPPSLWLGVVILLVALVATYLRAPANGILPEDDTAFWTNPAVTSGDPAGLFFGRAFDSRRDGFRPAVRPLTVTVQRIEYLLAGGETTADGPPAGSATAGSRGTVIRMQLLLLLAAGLAWLLAFRREWTPATAMAGALVVVLHPLGTSASLSLAGTAEVLALLFGGLSLWLAGVALGPIRGIATARAAFEGAPPIRSGKNWAVLLSGACMLLAIWSSEIAYLLAPVLAVRLWTGLRFRGADGPGGARDTGDASGLRWAVWLRHSFFLVIVAATAIALIHRAAAFAALPDHQRTIHAVESASGLGVLQRAYYGLAGCGEFVRILLLPFRLSYSNDYILSSGLTPLRALAGLALLVLLAIFLVRALRSGSGRATWVAWVLFGLIGANGILIPSPEIASPRLLFLIVPGVAGLVLSVAQDRLSGRAAGGTMPGVIAGVLAGIVVVLFGLRTADRVVDYRDWETLVRRQTEEFPRSAQSWFDLGNLGLSRGNAVAAVSAYEKATELRPTFWAAWINLGAAFATKEERGLAMRAYERVIAGVAGRRAFRVVEARAHYHRALILLTQNRNVEAAEGFEKMLEVFPDHLYSHANLGFLYSNSRSLYEKASEHLNRAMDMETDPARREVLNEYLNGIRARQARQVGDQGTSPPSSSGEVVPGGGPADDDGHPMGDPGDEAGGR